MTGLLFRLQFLSWLRSRRMLLLLAAMALALGVTSSWSTAGDIARRAAQA